jgi:hypothetical protein
MQAFWEKLGPYIWQVATVIVAIVLLIAAWAILRRVFNGRIRASGGGRARQPRLGIVDAFDLDRERQLVLIRRDNVEHLVMIGGPNDVLIESEIIRASVQTTDGRGRGAAMDDIPPASPPPPVPVPAPAPALAPAPPTFAPPPPVIAAPEPPAPPRRAPPPPPPPRVPPPLFGRVPPPPPPPAPAEPVTPPVVATPEPAPTVAPPASPQVEEPAKVETAPAAPPSVEPASRARFDFARLATRQPTSRPMTTPVIPKPAPLATEPAPVVEPPKVDLAPAAAEPTPAPPVEPPAPPAVEPPAPSAASTPDDGLLELEAEMAKLLGRPGDGGKA